MYNPLHYPSVGVFGASASEPEEHARIKVFPFARHCPRSTFAPLCGTERTRMPSTLVN